VEPGETILGFDLGNHLWIVISSATADGRIGVVSVTTYRPPDSDSTCVIREGEHPFIRHDSCVYYRRAELVALEPIASAKRDGSLRQSTSLSRELLRRVQEGAIASRFVSRALKDAVAVSIADDPEVPSS
jgi:hypothetical protein